MPNNCCTLSHHLDLILNPGFCFPTSYYTFLFKPSLVLWSISSWVIFSLRVRPVSFLSLAKMYQMWVWSSWLLKERVWTEKTTWLQDFQLSSVGSSPFTPCYCLQTRRRTSRKEIILLVANRIVQINWLLHVQKYLDAWKATWSQNRVHQRCYTAGVG